MKTGILKVDTVELNTYLKPLKEKETKCPLNSLKKFIDTLIDHNTSVQMSVIAVRKKKKNT